MNTNNPKLEIVRLSKIIPSNILPTFNSRSIELHLPFIPDLSERFLYANDDMMFASKVSENFFYEDDGHPKFRYLKSTLDLNDENIEDMYVQGIANSQRFIRDKIGFANDFKKSAGHLPHHNIDAYCKSTILEFTDRFSNEVQQVVHHPFRERSQFQRDVWAAYSMATRRGHFRFTQRPWWETILGGAHRESWYFSLGKKNAKKNFKRIRPSLFCVNDNPNAVNSDRENGKAFLSSIFPEKSTFEI
jgi:hypothetical protein